MNHLTLEEKGLTTLDLIGFRIIPDERSLRFRYLHQAVFLYLCQRDIRFIPLQTTVDTTKVSLASIAHTVKR